MVAGGVLTDLLSWRSTMGLLALFALIVLPLAPRLLPESLPHSLEGVGGAPLPERPASTSPARSPSPAACSP